MPKKSEKEPKTCYNCNNYGICKVQDAAGELLKLLAAVSKSNKDLHVELSNFVADRCRLYIHITDEENKG